MSDLALGLLLVFGQPIVVLVGWLIGWAMSALADRASDNTEQRS